MAELLQAEPEILSPYFTSTFVIAYLSVALSVAPETVTAVSPTLVPAAEVTIRVPLFSTVLLKEAVPARFMVPLAVLVTVSAKTAVPVTSAVPATLKVPELVTAALKLAEPEIFAVPELVTASLKSAEPVTSIAPALSTVPAKVVSVPARFR